jgi:hypothetical protein
VVFPCIEGRDTVVDISAAMHKQLRWGDAFEIRLSADAAVRWLAVGMNYEARLPEPVAGPPGAMGPQGIPGQSIVGTPGRDGAPGEPGRDGKCDCKHYDHGRKR